MKRFLIKTSWFTVIGAIPFLIVVIVYAVLDPFKVIKTYNPIFLGNVEGEVMTSRDYVGTVTLLNNYQQIPYNSFVFGNSRSLVFGVDDWKQHLSTGSNCFHYNAPSEALYALTKKVEFIDKKGLQIANALLVLDYGILVKDVPNSGHLFMMSPQLVDYDNIVDFHRTYFKAFLTPEFLKAYIDFKLTRKIKPYMVDNHLLNSARRKYNDITNEVRMDYFEDLIKKGKYYTPKRMSDFQKRDSIAVSYPETIKGSQKVLLKTIYDVLVKHATNYKIIISPTYDQKKIHEKDLEYLKGLFGEQRVFDFSGKNKYTEDYHNYYEEIHYRPHVAKEIMDEIYASPSRSLDESYVNYHR